jgi:prepilin-type N-terminal cleavage/methylation domain-containing protein
MKPDQHSRGGFTLLEVLLAILLASSIMTAVLLLTVGLGDIWRGTTPVRNLEVHSRQVVDFLKRGFRRALPVETDGLAYVFLDHSSGEFNTSGAPLLTWEVRETDGIISWQDQSLPYVIYQLEVVEDVGLVLYWQSRLEVDFEEVPPRQTLISPFVTGIEYH